MTVVVSFVGLCVLLGVGHLLRMKVRLLRKLYLPSCVIGGLVGLLILTSSRYGWWPIPTKWLSTWTPLPETWPRISANVTAGWNRLPGFLINIVFACLFLGVALPKFKTLWRRAGPQLAYGQVVAWGQYVVGVGLTIALLTPLFGVPHVFGGIVPVGFEGGHGTASGLQDTFTEMGKEIGWTTGGGFALASATAGIISAIVVGMILVNWAARRGYTVRRQSPEDVPEDDSIGVIPVDRRPIAGRLTVSSDAIESFTLHIVIVGLAVFIGYLLKQGLWLVEAVVNSGVASNVRPTTTVYRLINGFPLFPLCMLGGLVIQILEDRFDRYHLIDVGLTRRIQNTSLDFLVVAAITLINVRELAPEMTPFLIIVGAAILWNVFCVVVLARRMLPDAWFERSIAELGQSMGVTATGLLLLRVVDPNYESPAAEAFASKQLLHEPFMGGGLWTSMAIPLLFIYGGLPVFLIAGGAMAVWLAIIFLPRVIRRP